MTADPFVLYFYWILPTWCIWNLRNRSRSMDDPSTSHQSWTFAISHTPSAKRFGKYKQRAVLWVDNVKVDNEYRAVFTEQGASVSQMAAARFLDTISRLLGLDTQVRMSEAPRQPRLPEKEFISTRTDKAPAMGRKWKTSGFSWTKLALSSCGRIALGNKVGRSFIEPNASCEYLYVHRKYPLILSVHVDDVEMVGKKENCDHCEALKRASIWKIQPLPMKQQYLGCAQIESEIDHEAVQSKASLFRRVTTTEDINTPLSRSQRGVRHAVPVSVQADGKVKDYTRARQFAPVCNGIVL